MEQFKITRIYTDEHGDSHFEDRLVALHDAGPIGFLSPSEKVATLMFRKVASNYDYDFHNAPARQYIALLDGGIEIENSLGEIRRFATGDVLLVEDTTGKGHRSRNLQDRVRTSLFITHAD